MIEVRRRVCIVCVRAIVSVREWAHNSEAARREVRVVEGPRLHLPLGTGTLSITASGE
jgi:hypothetical protein